MVVLGVDPGTAITGFGVVERRSGAIRSLEYGVIRTPAGLPLPERLDRLFRELQAVLARHPVEVAAVEQLFFNKNVQTALSVGQARGVVLLAAAQAGLPVSEYTPPQVKQAVTGEGRAVKHQVAYMITRLLGLKAVPRPDDAADALAVAVCHAQTGSTLARWLGEGGA